MTNTNYIFEKDLARKQSILQFIKSKSLYSFEPELSLEEQREKTYQQMIQFIKSGLFKLSGVRKDPITYVHTFETLCMVDPTLAIKWGVNTGLFGTSILNLGTEKHQFLIDQIDSAETSGCFAMTELTHGSNVRDLKTTATYNHDTNKITINTPDNTAQKYWIGNAATNGEWAVVFAQLLMPSNSNLESKGIHPFLVRIRTNGKVLERVHTQDCGHKIGLNGVDNGRIWFDNLEVSVDSLLDKYGKIVNGKYQSEIKSNDERFGVMLSALTGGRVSLGSGCIYNAQSCLKTAINYGLFRRQFNDGKGDENILMSYPQYKKRLILPLFESFAYNIFNIQVKEIFSRDMLGGKVSKELHTLSSISKVFGSWFTVKTIHECRQACGGHGYASANRFGKLFNDLDIFTTFEGDNNVLLQQIVKNILSDIGSKYKSKSAISNFIEYLTMTLNNYVLDIHSTKSVLEFIHIQINLTGIKFGTILKNTPPINRLNHWKQLMIKAVKLCELYKDYHLLNLYSNWIKQFKSDNQIYPLLLIGEHLLRYQIIQTHSYFIYNSVINRLGLSNLSEQVDEYIIKNLEKLNEENIVKLIGLMYIPDEVIISPVGSISQFMKANQKLVSKL